MNQPYFTVTQAALQADVHRLTIHYWIKAQKLRAYRVGDRYRILVEDFEQFMNQPTKQNHKRNGRLTGTIESDGLE